MKTIEIVNQKTKTTYNLIAEEYHRLFHNEMNEKEYDQRLLDRFASKFTTGSLICDAGCGPSAHIGKFLFNKGLNVIGVDICPHCIELASGFNPDMKFKCEDIANLSCDAASFDGIVAYYSIIHTPKRSINIIFSEFNRVLKSGGYLFVAVKEGSKEGFEDEILGYKSDIYFSLFTESEISAYFKNAGFTIELLEKRNPCDFEIEKVRIFALGRKN